MKQLIYDFKNEDEGVVHITNEEFATALKLWNDKKDYYCQRLEALLPKPKLTKSLPQRFYIPCQNGLYRLFFFNDAQQLQEVIGGSSHEVAVTEELKNQLMTDDEYTAQYKRVTYINPRIQLK